jgi:hypothetical protein
MRIEIQLILLIISTGLFIVTVLIATQTFMDNYKAIKPQLNQQIIGI